MRWRRGQGGGSVDDRRSMRGGRAALPLGGGVVGVIATVLESFTHGTAEQRMTWFRQGFDAGDATACDSFSGDI